VVSDRWLPVSPNGWLDGYQWKLPLAELGFDRPVIEFTEAPAAPPVAEVTAEPSPNPAPEPQPAPVPEPPRKSAKTAKPKPVEPIIPLVHAPDDPGHDSGRLDSGLDRDPIPEPTTPPMTAWQRVLQLFR
jgi:HemY protein